MIDDQFGPDGARATTSTGRKRTYACDRLFQFGLFVWHAIIASGRVRSFSEGGAKIAR